MLDVAIQQRNKGFFMVPYSLLRVRTAIETFIEGIIFSFSKKGNVCEWGYTDFWDKVRISRSSLWRKNKKMKDDPSFEVTRKGGKCSTYQYIGDDLSGAHIRIEYYFCTEEFLFVRKKKDKQGNVIAKWQEERHLTPAEILVLGLIYSHWLNGKKFRASYHQMAGILDYAPETVCRAVNNLFDADLIARPKTGKKGQSNEFTVGEMLRFIETGKKKGKRTQRKQNQNPVDRKNATLQKAIDDADSRADFERYYAKLRQEAQARADKYMGIAEQNPQFKEVKIKLGLVEMKIGVSEVRAPQDVPRLLAERKRLLTERGRILFEMGISEELLEPRWRCTKCSDTGYLPHGVQCSCYSPPQGTGKKE